MPAPEDLSFDAVTAIRPAAEAGTFAAEVNPLWAVGDKPNGGYLQAILGRAARTVASGPDANWEVVSSSITYLRAPAFGPADIRTTVLRAGRTAAQVRAVLLQDGAELVDAVMILAVLPDEPARYDSTARVELPDPEECVRLPSTIPGGIRVGIMDIQELRIDPATVPFAQPVGPDARAELRGWYRFEDGRQPDALSLLFSPDATPPATFMIGSSGWVPTLQMCTYVRARPAPGWLGFRMAANVVAGGMVDETCEVWDSRGRVVAQANQLARVRFPDEVG
jgi:acyl-Coa thioesterase superfamily protein/acyl-CoA thioesterase superfamily protein